MKQHMKRFAALLLAVVMAASMAPAFAFASEDDISDFYEDSQRQPDGYAAILSEEDETEAGEEALPAPDETDEAAPEPDEDIDLPEDGSDFDDEAAYFVAAAEITKDVEINAKNFPDEFFRNYVSAFDTNDDDVLSVAELEAVTVINVYHLGISDLTGVKHFANLVSLTCSYNQLTSLDVSGLAKLTTLNCGDNKLTSLKVGGCASLIVLNCSFNVLTSLDLSGLSALKQLYCEVNRLTSLNLSGYSALITLTCYRNRLKSLKLTGLGELQTLRCNNNELVSLDLKGLDRLEYLYCTDNLLTSLANLPASLKRMECENNRLTSLPKLPESLETLSCYANRLTSIPKLPDSLAVLYCRNNLLTVLPVIPASMRELDCDGNRLKSLDLSDCVSLETLYCRTNSLTSLNLTGCVTLSQLYCQDNFLASLTIAGCAELQDMRCGGNLLRSLDAGGLNKLTTLYCDNNLLTSINLAGCTTLYDLQCRINLLETLDVSGCESLVWLQCDGNLLTDLTLSGLTDLTGLFCYENRLTALDLSDCVKLNQLYCYDNPLTGLDLSGLNDLAYLECRIEAESFDFTDIDGNTLSVQASGGGTVVFEDFSLSSLAVSLRAIPGDGYAFTRWAGGVDGSDTEYYAEITMSGDKAVTAVFAPLLAKSISLSPSRAVLTTENDSAVFTLTLSPATADRAPIKWEVSANAAVTYIDSDGTDTLTITANDPYIPAEPAELLVRATYGGENGLTATAKLQLLPGGIDYENMQLTLLETKATINTAKINGALIPVLISERGALSTAALGEASAMASAGSEIDADIQLLIKDNAGNLIPAAGFNAVWYEKDARYIEVKAEKGTPSLKDVTVRLVPKSGSLSEPFEATGKLNLTVTEVYPKITVTASGSLNLFFPGEGVTLSASSPEGDCEIILSEVEIVSDKDKKNIEYDKVSGKVTLAAGAAKGDYKLSVPVKGVPGYKDPPYATGKVPTVTVKVVNAAPKLKLGAKSVVLAENGNYEAIVGILSADKGVATAEVIEKIEKIYFEDGNTRGIRVYYERRDDAFGLWTEYFGPKSGGKGQVVVTFIGGASTVKLPISIKVIPNAKLTPSSKTKAMTVNFDNAQKASLDIPVTVNAANMHLYGWQIVSTGSGKTLEPFDNSHDLFGALGTSDLYDSDWKTIGTRLEVKSDTALKAWFVQGNDKDNDKKIVLNLGSPALPDKTIKITLTVTKKDAGFSVKVSNSGKLNVADPNASVVVTLTLKNTSALIDDVNTAGLDDFTSDSGSGNTFAMYLIKDRKANIEMAAQTVEPVITLSDGQVIKPKIKLTPVFSAPKAKSSAKAVTLLTLTPEVGANVNLSLTAPKGASVGAVVVDPASYAALGFVSGKGLEVKQSGEGAYTIYFEGCNPPQMKPDKNGNPVKLKSSYNLKLQVWAAGTYLTDPAGKPLIDADGKVTPLNNGAATVPKAMTKPVIVSVKVNVK